MTGLEAMLFRRRLSQHGFEVHQFHYHSVSAELPQVLDNLESAILALGRPVHLVGHSLGGLVALSLVGARPNLPIGRVVLLGSPVNGSRAARAFTQWPGSSLLFGQLADAELVATTPRPANYAVEIGVIAGSQPIGVGRIFGVLPEPNDGTVSLDETVLEGATDSIVLPVSHTGMMVSQAVVASTAAFLANGRFSDRAT